MAVQHPTRARVGKGADAESIWHPINILHRLQHCPEMHGTLWVSVTQSQAVEMVEIVERGVSTVTN